MAPLDIDQHRVASFASTGERVLSSREVQVLERVALGYANREIGDALSISEGTVKNHLKSILRKLDARDRTHAVVLAMAGGMLQQPASIVDCARQRIPSRS